jgi:hypothetical protein
MIEISRTFVRKFHRSGAGVKRGFFGLPTEFAPRCSKAARDIGLRCLGSEKGRGNVWMHLPTSTARIHPSHKNPAEYHAPGGDRNSRPIYSAISITRGMVFADGHHTLGWM